jgi:hypothetical protein
MIIKTISITVKDKLQEHQQMIGTVPYSTIFNVESLKPYGIENIHTLHHLQRHPDLLYKLKAACLVQDIDLRQYVEMDTESDCTIAYSKIDWLTGETQDATLTHSLERVRFIFPDDVEVVFTDQHIKIMKIQ